MLIRTIAISRFGARRGRAGDASTKADLHSVGSEIADYFIDGQGPLALNFSSPGEVMVQDTSSWNTRRQPHQRCVEAAGSTRCVVRRIDRSAGRHALTFGSRLRRSLHAGDEGFTLVELLVTMLVMATIMLGLVAVQTRALQNVNLSKQRQQATALANRTIEQMRALPYDTLTGGLKNTDTSSDPNITTVSGTVTFKPSYNAAISETLVTSSTQAAEPLYPHVQPLSKTTIGNTKYDVRTYVTRVDPTRSLGYWLTVVVKWTSLGRSKFAAVRSQVFSPTGCNASSTATRPFAGPCQAFLYTDAGTSAAGISVDPVTAGQQLVSGIDAVGLDSSTPALSVRTQNEQIVSTQASATTSRLAIASSGGLTGSGGNTATSAADTDPATGIGGTPATPSTVSFTGSSPQTVSSGVGSFTVTAPAADGAAYSTTTAVPSPACVDDLNVAITSGMACASASVTPNGSYEAQLQLNMVGRSNLVMSLSKIGSMASPNTWRAYGARAATAAGTHCPTTTGIGCATSGIRRAVGLTTAGTLPTASAGDIVPSGFTAMAQLTSFSAQVGAEAGVGGLVSPSASRAATLSYWNGSSMVPPFAVPAAGGAYTLGSATAVYLVDGVPRVTIVTSGRVTADPVSTAGAVPCAVTGCTSTATAGGIRMVVQYDVTIGASTSSFVVTTDLGSTIAQSTYKAAPSA